MAGHDWAGPLLCRIAVPRLVGSPSLHEVNSSIAERLEANGYEVSRVPFLASSASLGAVSVLGAGLGWSAIGIAPLLVFPVSNWVAVILGVAAVALVGLLAWGVAEGRLPIRRPGMPAENLVARRGKPRLWFVAHSDSKAQRFSMLIRVVGALFLAVGGVGLVSLLAARMLGPVPWWTVLPVVGLLSAGGAVMSGSAARDESPGAVDNATGVVAALVAAEQLCEARDVGVLITGAEELGMEGARAWVEAETPHGLFINFDGLDARGRFRLMLHLPHGDRVAAATAREMQRGVAQDLASRGFRVVKRSLPFGILVDGSVLASAGMAGVTVSRGDWETLSVIHTSWDRIARVDVAVAVAAGEAAADAAHSLAS